MGGKQSLETLTEASLFSVGGSSGRERGPTRRLTAYSGSTRILPPFCPSVLKPGLDLRVRHLQGLGQGGTFSRRQVLLSVEAFLQLADLHPTK